MTERELVTLTAAVLATLAPPGHPGRGWGTLPTDYRCSVPASGAGLVDGRADW